MIIDTHPVSVYLPECRFVQMFAPKSSLAFWVDLSDQDERHDEG